VSATAAHSTSATADTVFLLHGMGRTTLSMARLATHLSGAGYNVVNLGYPSTRQSVAESASQLDTELKDHCERAKGQAHFVTHSLGGIIVRAYLKQHSPANLGRVVMISPPNQGSEIADKLQDNIFYKWSTGPAGQELGTGDNSTPNQLGPVNFPLGVITGDRSLNPIFSSWIGGPSDGKVSVKRAAVTGMTDFLVVNHSHTYIMRSRSVAEEVVHFLKQGRFADGMNRAQ
jgi:triacylglycerol lipase